MHRICLATLLVLGSVASAQETAPSVRARAMRRSGPISVNGKLDEATWASAPRHGGFVQRFPKDAAKPSHDTQFSILYDDEAIYVGVWAEDPRPDLIRALLTRRDVESPSDSVMIAFDSYHDRRTAYSFQLNAAGVQRDTLMSDDSNEDDTWDAVWTGDVAMTSSGWTAEYRIPLSQLRYATKEVQEWGFQLQRTIGRTGEQDTWSPWPRNAPQVVSKFGVVEGIEHLRPATRLELLPYVSGGGERMPVEAGDPLNDAYGFRGNVGLDVKYGLGPAFTLSATINPDFGQVEADPSAVNLSANELFFAEKRPFFLEGVDLFRLPIGNGGGAEGAFYSRRIGAAPSTPDDYDYIKAPQATTIYGAAKLTGKTPGGWSVGLLDAVTGEEKAEIMLGDVRSKPIVAPLTNYALARVKRDLGEGATSIGMSATAVNRKLDGTGLESSLHDQAYTGGLQLQHRWADNAWTADVYLLGSYVHGSPEAIEDTQTSARHYFQRPDATNVHVDPRRESLSGLAAKWMVGRLGETKHWQFGTGGNVRTAGLELNDAGFQRSSNEMVPFVLVEYRDNDPGDHILNWGASADVFWMQTLEPRYLQAGLEYNGHVQLSNYWELSGGGNLSHAKWNVNALRGGRALRADPNWFHFASINTDTRKPVWFSLNGNGSINPTSSSHELGLDLGATLQARSNLDVFIGPSVYTRSSSMQYIDEVSDSANESHYVFGRIHETQTAMTLRVNWTFSPHLALQAYAQPFVATGRYDELKDVDNPHAAKFADRFHRFAPGELRLADGTYQVDRGGRTFSFDQPNFNFRQVRSTVVLRWEYRPGSTVFAIWSHGRTSDAFDGGRFRLGHDLSELGRADSENIVMVKANYWIGL